MKIGLVLDDSLDSSDGVQQYVLTLGEWLGAKGYSVHYLVGQTKRTDIKNLHSFGRKIPVRFNKNRLYIPLPVSKKAIKDLLSKENFDVLHVQMPYSPQFAHRVILSAPKQCAVVGTFHIVPYSHLVKHSSRILSLIVKKSLARIDQIICVSSAAQSFCYGVFNKSSIIIPNAINLKLFKYNKKPKSDGLKIVFLGRLVKRKGARQLLYALGHLKNSNRLRKVRIIIGGKGPELKRLKKNCKKLELSQVEWLGFIPEEKKASFLGSADIAVFPATGGESFGIVLLEAIAAGAGVVLGGNNEGYKSILGAFGECLFDANETEEFASVLQKFMSDAKLRKSIHRKQQSSVKQYDITLLGPKIVNEYRRAIAKRNP